MMAMDLNGLLLALGLRVVVVRAFQVEFYLAIGFSKEEAQCGIRLSFPPNITMETVEELKKD